MGQCALYLSSFMSGTNIAIVCVNSHDIVKILHNMDIKLS
jgi:hypothetical protein